MHHLRQLIRTMVVVVAAGACTTSVLAEVTAEEAAQLGGPVLTLFGAEKAGNKEGTIPAYTGSEVKAPLGWDPKIPGQRPDPYGEKPLFSITAQNAAQYADKLDGMVEIFKRYPNFRMDVYPSHRDWVFPQYVLDNTIKNASACKAASNELKLEGCYGGLPFPIPKSGNQAMWNHLVSYHSWNMGGKIEYWLVPPTSEPFLVSKGEFVFNWPYYDPAKTAPHPANQIYYRFIEKTEAPVHKAGNQLMILDPVDPLDVGRRAYVYVQGRRWAKLSAELAYDTISPNSGGAATMDDSKVFYGALDRYDFKLVGKKEKFIYYNNYRLTDEKACSNQTLHSSKGFPNPDCIRWELHRVWVVQATLKPGFNHVYHKRVFYWDEDGFAGGQSENYDAGGKLYRFVSNSIVPFFEAPGGFTSNLNMDLKTGSWTSQGVGNCSGCGRWPVTTRWPESMFTPDAMAGSGIR